MPPPPGPSTAMVGALHRLLRSPEPESGIRHRRLRCELCSEGLNEAHEHILELATHELACVCTACALLFESPAAGRRRIPRDSRFLNDFELTGAEWASLQIPVALAFLARNSQTADLTAAYPSPAGVVTARVEAAVWQDLCRAHPVLTRLQPDVEALLINRIEKPCLYFTIPLDQAFSLAGQIRKCWTGLNGGPQVRQAIADFCSARVQATAPRPERAGCGASDA